MATSHSALVAVAQARRGDKVLMSSLAAAAGKLRSDAEAQAASMRDQARQLRRHRWAALQAAKVQLNEANGRLTAIQSLELQEEVRAAAIIAARRDISVARRTLREAAQALEAAVSRAQTLEAKAEDVLRSVHSYPEVAAWEAITLPAEQRGVALLPGRDGSDREIPSRKLEAHGA